MGIIKTHSRSCVLDAFAHVLNVHPRQIIEYLNHDGAERGFHTQELIDFASDRKGSTVTEIHRFPVSVNPITGLNCWISFPQGNAETRFCKWLASGKGVLLGQTKYGVPHAVSWKHQQIHDPSTGRSYDLLKPNYEGFLERTEGSPSFHPTKFLKIQTT